MNRAIDIEVQNKSGFGRVIGLQTKWALGVQHEPFGNPLLRKSRVQENEMISRAFKLGRKRLMSIILEAKRSPDCKHQHSNVGKVLSSGNSDPGDGMSYMNNIVGLCVECHNQENLPPEEIAAFIEKIRPGVEQFVNEIYERKAPNEPIGVDDGGVPPALAKIMSQIAMDDEGKLATSDGQLEIGNMLRAVVEPKIKKALCGYPQQEPELSDDELRAYALAELMIEGNSGSSVPDEPVAIKDLMVILKADPAQILAKAKEKLGFVDDSDNG